MRALPVVTTTLAELNTATSADFVRLVGPFFEHSPWIAEKAAALRPFASGEFLFNALCEVVAQATVDQQLTLIRAHPDLVGRIVLTAESQHEQTAAGLIDLTPPEVAQFQRYNEEYQARFQFPFIICARLNKKDAILRAFPVRLQNSAAQEQETAVAEIYKIAQLRLTDLLAAPRGKLSTHVLNLVSGRPAAGMTIELRSGVAGELLKTVITNDDGRTAVPLFTAAEMKTGAYELTFFVGQYFQDSSFLDRVPIRFQIADVNAGYHVPLLCTPMGLQHISRELMRRCAELAAITEVPGEITRTFHSPAMQRANKQVGAWMRAAKLEVGEDAAFNLIGRWSSASPRAKTLLLGSHLDTVRNAGKYDGPLGVLVALAAVEMLRTDNILLPFNIEVIGFSDEEGVRYQTTYLGSRAMIGALSKSDLDLIEEKGLDAARRDPSEFLAYAEVHIEQGPVLEARKKAIGVVTSIAGQSRLRLEFIGHAGHAGTTPMLLRRDALGGAAEFISAVEKTKILATVGQLEIAPGASNVIPGSAKLTLDVRDQRDGRRRVEVKRLHKRAIAIAKRRKLKLKWVVVQESTSVRCHPGLTKLMKVAAGRYEKPVLALPSGAGHDGAVMAKVCPMTMLFVRCKDGLSHHPAESVKVGDVAKAVAALHDFILLLREDHV